jgi:hypothetical protein
VSVSSESRTFFQDGDAVVLPAAPATDGGGSVSERRAGGSPLPRALGQSGRDRMQPGESKLSDTDHPALGAHLVGTEVEHRFSWSDLDLILYALSVGARHPRDLPFLYEGADHSGPRAAATFPLVAAARIFDPFTKALHLDLGGLLHVGQQFDLIRHPEATGTATITRTVTAVSDKKTGALLECRDKINDDVGPLARATSQWWVRDAGGFGGGARPAQPPTRAPDRPPDHLLCLTTST